MLRLLTLAALVTIGSAQTGQRVSSALLTCGNYCASLKQNCLGAWEDKENSCNPFLAKETCATNFKTKYADTSDMCCLCGGTSTGPGPTYPPTPTTSSGSFPSCSGAAPKCISGKPATGGFQAGIKIGMLGDTGGSSGFKSVLSMLKNQGVNLILHAGDMGYTQATPSTWTSAITSIMGSSFPYVAAIGNHDSGSSSGWSLSQSYKAVYDFAVKLGTCKGETGASMVCTYKGVTIVVSAADEVGSISAVPGFIRDAFRNYPNKWRICLWHKNQKTMQMGDKSDEVGWAIYEECRKQGAMTITGHQHQYSRSHTMTGAQSLSIKDTSNTLELRPGTSGTNFVVVTGLGGYDSRDFSSSLKGLKHWASGHNNMKGALICTFQDTTASCAFKDHNGVTKDSFNVKTFATAVASAEIAEATVPVFDEIEATTKEIAAESRRDQKVTCQTLPHVSLGFENDGHTVGLRFGSVNLNPENIGDVKEVYIEFRVGQAGSVRTDLTIRGEHAADPTSMCEGKISTRRFTNTTVAWNTVDAFDEPNNGHKTPDLTSLLKEMVTNGWQKGGSLAFFIEGSGKRSVRNSGEEHEFGPRLIIKTQVSDQATVKPRAAGCVYEEHVAYTGGSAMSGFSSDTDASGCCEMCQQKDGCKTFSLKQGKCSLFSSVGVRVYDGVSTGVVSGALYASRMAHPYSIPLEPLVEGDTQSKVLVSAESEWAYLTVDPTSTTWFDREFDDTMEDGGWKRGKAPLGFGAAGVTYGSNITKGDFSVSFRNTFELTTDEWAGVRKATLKFRCAPGAEVWLNGAGLYQDPTPTSDHTSADGQVQLEVSWQLHAGKNVLAIQVANPVESSSLYLGDFTFTLDYVPGQKAPPTRAPTTARPTPAPTPEPPKVDLGAASALSASVAATISILLACFFSF